MFVERGAVELREGKRIAREMRGHPIEDDADPALVQVVDEKRKVLGRAIALRRRIEARDLVAPRPIERVLGHRHDLHMGKAHFHCVIGELWRELAVAEEALGLARVAPPRAEVHFVNRYGPVECVECVRRAARALAAGMHPRGVAPSVVPRIAHDRGIPRRGLEVLAVGIGLKLRVARLIADLEFIQRARPKPGDEKLPHARAAERAHRVVAAVPSVEVADERDLRRIGSPHGKTHALHALVCAHMGSKFIVNPVLVALAKQIEIVRAQRRQKRIRVAQPPRAAARVCDIKRIHEMLAAARELYLEKTGGVEARHRPALAHGGRSIRALAAR